MKKVLKYVLFLYFFLIFPITVHGEMASLVTVETDYGFHGVVKSGNCFPLRVKITNHQKQQNYHLEIHVPAQAETDSISSSIWMNGESWNNNQDRMTVYEKDLTLDMQETIEEIFYLNLPVLEGVVNVYVKDGNQIVALETLNCSFTDNTYRILIGIISESNEDLESLDGMHVTMDGYYGSDTFVKTIPLEPKDIYTNPDALNQLDVLIADVDTVFSKEQERALNKWEKNGGFYLKRESESLVECFQRLLVGEQREDFLNHLHEMTSYFFGDAADLSGIPVSEKPNLLKYLVILIIYILIAGPGLYIFLKIKDRQKYMWIGICGNALVFLMMICVLGVKTNIRAPYICYSALYEQNEQMMSERIDFSIQAPYNSPYHMYVDNSYEIAALHENTYGSNAVNEDVSEKVTISYGEEKNQITIENMSTFTSNAFSLTKNTCLSQEEQIQLDFQVAEDGKSLYGKWKNPTEYSIKCAMLVMPNQAAVLGDIRPQSSSREKEYELYSYGNSGIELLMNDLLDFSGFKHQEYESTNLANQIWSTLYNVKSNQAYLLGIIENGDVSFQKNSGYKTYGTSLIRIPVSIDWEVNTNVWCPNLKIHSESLDGNYNSETNLMNGNEATVDYAVQSFVTVEKLQFYQMDYDDKRYFYPFEGKIALYNWMTGEYQELQEWNLMLQGYDMTSYISSTGVLRIRYLLDDTINDSSRSCMLPCIRLAGKVRG